MKVREVFVYALDITVAVRAEFFIVHVKMGSFPCLTA